MLDALIVGAGPAGAVAATVLARAGATVRILDRSAFPRDKLCGDTLNPGTLTLLRSLGLAETIDATGLPIDGMMVTGPGGVTVRGAYPAGIQGRSLVRRELDWSLLSQAIDAGAAFEPSMPVRRAVVDEQRQRAITGVVVATRSGEETLHARVVVAADGRRSALAAGLGLSRPSARPRRWAIGAYFDDVRGMSSLGEMHVRAGGYIGVAPMPGGLANVCVVKPRESGVRFREVGAFLRAEIQADPLLRDRFQSARLVSEPVVLGPLAVDVRGCALDGLLLAGDAAGFIDPMTGDGMRFAVHGGQLAAEAALRALEDGWSGVHRRLARERRHAFGGKWRFNRALRRLVSSPAAVRAGGAIASFAPAALGLVVRRAGDCALAAPPSHA